MKQKIFASILIAVGIIIVLLFGLRTLRVFKRIHEGGGFSPRGRPTPSQTDVELIRGWMTIPYIAQTYAAPERFLFKELDIPEQGNRNKSLDELNNEYYPDQPGFVLAKIKELISSHQPPIPLTPPPTSQ